MNKIKVIGISDEKHHSGSLYKHSFEIYMLIYLNAESAWLMVNLANGMAEEAYTVKENAIEGFTFLGHDMNIELKP